MKSRKKRLALLIVLMLVIIAALSAVALHRIKNDVTDTAGQAVHGDSAKTALEYDGRQYELDPNVETYLFVGLDSSDVKVDEKSRKFYNHIMADVLVLVAVNKESREIKLIQLNRDTMSDVPWLDAIGQYGGTAFRQLALAYNSGNGGLKSLRNTRDAVSILLFDAPIDHCLAFTMAGIDTLNDLVGGVTVMVKDDLTAVDPAFERGSKITLKGKQAQSFLRARMILSDDTNAARMSRHRDYFEGFLKSARAAMTNPEFVAGAAEKLEPYTVTDMTLQQLSALSNQLNDYGVSSMRYPDGELRINEYYEFYPDPDSLWEIVSDVYCK